MKMKKKLIKNQNILNRNSYINYYSNYMIYNYLNNYNLKFFFFFLIKKKYYISNKKKILFYNKSNTYKNCIQLNKIFYFNNANTAKTNFKDKFFDKKLKLFNSYSFINNNLILEKNKINLIDNKLILSNQLNFIDLKFKDVSIKFKEIFLILFIINLVKMFEIYKMLLNLIYLNAKI